MDNHFINNVEDIYNIGIERCAAVILYIYIYICIQIKIGMILL